MLASLCNQVEEAGMEVVTEKSIIKEQKRMSKINTKQIQRGKEQEEKESTSGDESGVDADRGGESRI